MNKRFLNYGHFKGPKRGNFGVFWESKLKLNFLSMFGQFFFIDIGSNIFWGIQKRFRALRDKRYLNYGRFKGLKRGNFGFFGVKLETQLSKHLWSVFFTKSRSVILLGIQTKF